MRISDFHWILGNTHLGYHTLTCKLQRYINQNVNKKKIMLALLIIFVDPKKGWIVYKCHTALNVFFKSQNNCLKDKPKTWFL